ncbi:transposase (plasmid) [Rhizobium leguminosarum]|uniref:transposase n=1 Tax=Rhizobium TaxID=379 RepID=UPI0010303004|nr:transposase [Rhizobium leguminosarum]NEI03178.1 transposase [Rhizobium leguminosarum]NEJ82414.1 transposase [Rhizobium leguminosarum]TBF90529.1 transposase [Rhizobium leguminosarum]TBG07772.1 transposase [Rhizobium leguminosarum]TBG09769.1 transposase [Rhizobium leguminosarum]
MRTDDPGRRFSREVKLAVVQRMAAGANVSKLARELGISRKGLYQWQTQFRVGGASALREGGRPQRGAAASHAQPEAGALQSSSSDELLRALARITELERLVGQQSRTGRRDHQGTGVKRLWESIEYLYAQKLLPFDLRCAQLLAGLLMTLAPTSRVWKTLR